MTTVFKLRTSDFLAPDALAPSLDDAFANFTEIH